MNIAQVIRIGMFMRGRHGDESKMEIRVDALSHKSASILFNHLFLYCFTRIPMQAPWHVFLPSP